MTASPERAELTAVLQELKQRTGLSLSGLEERTPFSRSSWGRYLKGETLPPREAVRQLCRLAGEPEGHCLALWELAESETSGRAAPPAPEPAPEPTLQSPPEPAVEGPASVASPEAAPGPPTSDPPTAGSESAQGTELGPWHVVAVGAVMLAVVLAGTVAAVLLLLSGSPAPKASGTSSPAAATTTAPPNPRCRAAACEARDPMNMLCGSTTHTLATHRTATGARLELRHSPRCGASWARMWSTEVGDRLEVTGAGPTHSTEVVDALDARNYLYTPMTATTPGTLVRACFRPAAKVPRECFEATVRPPGTASSG
ncbi:hypothetical protein GCM10009601_02650 [Streptomyces thermospinosisporus]|uniref:DUF2690 domain-containing protein n=1 Tax=Streptomyces thermospinosisporus TaxID=161482 RepID=A0ABP4J6I0_9ACTN